MGKISLNAAVGKVHERLGSLDFGTDLKVGLDAAAGEVGLQDVWERRVEEGCRESRLCRRKYIACAAGGHHNCVASRMEERVAALGG